MVFINNMNISPIKYAMPKIVFKSYIDNDVIGYDDAISEAKRDYIRQHYYKWTMPYYNIYEKEGRLTDYQIALFISDLEKNHEMKKIDETNNIYRGQTLVEKPEYLKAIKQQKGIKTVIDLVGYGKTYEENVRQAGMDYFVYSVYKNWWDKSNVNQNDKDILVQFLRKMQDGNIYIGCQHGANDTDIAFILNDFFNPLLEGKAKKKIKPNESDFPMKLNSFYDLFTKEDKKLLGWTKEFEQRLIRKLISI
jgi:hypothetical protein